MSERMKRSGGNEGKRGLRSRVRDFFEPKTVAYAMTVSPDQSPGGTPGDQNGHDIEAQRELLDVIHLSHIDTLTRTGILDKVRDAVAATGNQLLGQPTVAVHEKNIKGSADTITEYFVLLDLTEPNESGDNHTTTRIVPVAEEFSGVVSPVGNFNDDDAEVVSQMVNGLRELHEQGFLPDLDPHSLRIEDPETLIQVYHPSESDDDGHTEPKEGMHEGDQALTKNTAVDIEVNNSSRTTKDTQREPSSDDGQEPDSTATPDEVSQSVLSAQAAPPAPVESITAPDGQTDPTDDPAAFQGPAAQSQDERDSQPASYSAPDPSHQEHRPHHTPDASAEPERQEPAGDKDPESSFFSEKPPMSTTSGPTLDALAAPADPVPPTISDTDPDTDIDPGSTMVPGMEEQ